MPLTSRGPDSHSSQEQLSSIPPPPEDSNTVQEEFVPSKSNEHPQETDFPLEEGPVVQRLEPAVVPLIPTDSLCCAMIEQAFDYLPKQDDDDDDDDNDVVHQSSFQENEDEPIYDNNDFERENQSDGGDSVDTIDLDAEPRNYQQNNSKCIASR